MLQDRNTSGAGRAYKVITAGILLTAAMLAGQSCAAFKFEFSGIKTSYKHMPPLEFKDISYPWPVKYANMPGGFKMAYVDVGSGRPVVLVHGLGSYMKFWVKQVDYLSRNGYRVIAVDLPGYGKSDKPSTYPYTMEAFGDTLLEFFRQRGISKPVIFGHSMGGHTAISMAIRYPDALTGMVLAAPAGFEKFSKREAEWFKGFFRNASLFRYTNEYMVWRIIRYDNFSNWRDEYEWLIENRVRTARNKDFDKYGYANIKSIHGLLNTDFTRKNLDKIRIPTLIIHGDQDKLIPNPYLHGGRTASVMKFGEKNIKGAKRAELGGCGHTVQMDCPNRFNSAALRFLKRVY